MTQSLLPPELLLQLFSECTKDTLTRVARINRATGTLAEQVLYSDIEFSSHDDDVVVETLLRTLATKPHKAAYVFQFHLVWGELEEELLEQFCTTLKLMNNLAHLSLGFDQPDSMAEPVIAALRNATFSLTSLRIPIQFQLESWVSSQTKLETILLSQKDRLWEVDPKDAKIIQLHDWARTRSQGSSALTTISIIQLSGVGYTHLISFPSLMPNGTKDWDAKIITRHFPHLCYSMRKFTLFVDTLADTQELARIIDSLEEEFYGIDRIILAVKDGRIDSNPEKISEILASLPRLCHFGIRSWSDEFSMDNGRMTYLARSWTSQNISITTVQFSDSIVLTRTEGADEWAIDEEYFDW